MTTIYIDKTNLPSRRAFDHYPTERTLITAALKAAHPSTSSGRGPENVESILDPGAGDGRWGAIAKTFYPAAILHGVELRQAPRPAAFDGWYTQDFLTFTPARQYDLIVGNPPYGPRRNGKPLAEWFIRHSWQLSPTDTQKIEHWTSKLLMFLAFGSFVLSYAGMYAVAVDAGYSWLSFLWPLVTETAVVIFSLVYLVAKLKGYENRWLMPLIVGCTALSVAFNVWHSPKADYLTRSVVALPPLLLFASFKMWIWKIEQDTKRQGAIVGIDELNSRFTRLQLDLSDFEREADQKRQEAQTELDHLAQRVAQRQEALSQRQTSATKPADVSDETREIAFTILDEWTSQNVNLNRKGAKLAREMSSRLGRNVSRQTGLTLLKAYQKMTTAVEKNVNGTQKTGSLGRLVDALPLDDGGKEALKKSADRLHNGQQGGEQ